ncbi:IclR family transcriptional regulator C-terminal domain-containing protein [Streptomyces sp. NPDC050738]|uniref:IclR family transcriptional regulator domain-containing protein n=1 Tax=Streptomyces sp. NPDC050738 TaxID=3154744 RepID=UPI003446C827
MTSPESLPDATDCQRVGPLERGLAVLRVLCAPDADRLRHSDLVRATGLARSTVDRVVATLDRLALVRSDGREVSLAPRLMEVSGAYLRSCGIPAALGPLTQRLADEFDESVSVSVPDGDGVRFVTQARRRRAMSVSFRIGDLLPAARCAPGALFAAPWSKDQWAGDDQLIEPGLIAVAVPVRGPAGRTVCAVSVVSHTSRHTLQSLREAVLPRLRDVRTDLEAALAAPRTGEAPPATTDISLTLKRELGPEFLQSLARGLAVLVALGGDRGEGMTLSAVAEATGLARATVRRSLLTLVQLGQVSCEGSQFRLEPRVLELGCARLSELRLPEIAQPHLTELVERVHESASLVVLDGTDIRYVARVPTVRIMSISITVGTRLPAYATSMGRVLLAGLAPEERPELPTVLPALTQRTVTSARELGEIVERVAAEGFALVEEELEEGLRSLAVPVRDARGRVAAALNVAQHAGRGTAEEARVALLPALREAAEHIEADIRALRPF